MKEKLTKRLARSAVSGAAMLPGWTLAMLGLPVIAAVAGIALAVRGDWDLLRAIAEFYAFLWAASSVIVFFARGSE